MNIFMRILSVLLASMTVASTFTTTSAGASNVQEQSPVFYEEYEIPDENEVPQGDFGELMSTFDITYEEADKAVAWAENMIGRTTFDDGSTVHYYCSRFVRDAYEYGAGYQRVHCAFTIIMEI